ncbi:MAG: tRNA (adenosine(37)-N6)-dimethylallyltransferase MiaA [Treponema sp.]|jgi:tRNA dimethylallyltransferase|nr:tRNA (adenosine(37)-N6)-dimethylallyltransferase MiaA [Treponema sp.]
MSLPIPQIKSLPVLVLFGPTASGKTDVIRQVFTSSQAEVVSADSMQVYRGMDIGTAKPSPRLQALIPHHLIDILEPDQEFNVGDFVRLADAAVKDIWSRGKLPVVSGGTGFYLKNFIQGLPLTPPSDADIRAQLKAELQASGVEPLIRELGSRDAVSAGRIHPNDSYRLLRALEVLRLTNKPLSSFSMPKKIRDDFDFLLIDLERPRDELYARIDERCAQMFKDGLAEEVHGLFGKYGADVPGMRAIGYREFFQNGQFRSDFGEVEALIARNSRRYAKRQITFFASIPGVTRLNADDTLRILDDFIRGVAPFGC